MLSRSLAVSPSSVINMAAVRDLTRCCLGQMTSLKLHYYDFINHGVNCTSGFGFVEIASVSIEVTKPCAHMV